MEVVRRVGDPLRHEPAAVLVEVDRDHLPVRLVVVHAVEARPPVVVGEEEPVLADRPAALPDHAAVVDVPLVRLLERRVLEGRRRRRRAGHLPAHQQRQREEAVRDPRQQPSPGEAADARVEAVLLALGERAGLADGLRALPQAEGTDEAEVEERPEGRRARRDEPVHREGSLRDDLLVPVVRVVEPEAGRRDVAIDVHREELLALRVAHDRLERPEELEVSGCRGDSVWGCRVGHWAGVGRRTRPGRRAG